MMHDENVNGSSADDWMGRVQAVLDERLDVEALAMAVEHHNYANQLSDKLKAAFSEVRSELGRLFGELRERVNRSHATLLATQEEVRELILDVALLKRAAVTQGQVGVLERRRIERELVLELMPPTRPRPGAGVQVAVHPPAPPRRVDCENRLHLCKAACCRIFEAPLTAQEVETDRYDWDPRHPYVLRRERVGCVHLRGGTCECSVYHDRPLTCRNYSCENDPRIWSDFEKKVLNPELATRLASLDVVTIPRYAPVPPVEVRGAEPMEGVSPAPPTPSAPAPSAAAPTTPTAQATTEIKEPAVAPPNFDDLRELIIPRPNKVFIPPVRGEASPDAASN